MTTIDRRRQIADILRRAATYPWTHGTFAVDLDGLPTSVISPTAVGYCVLGKIERAAHESPEPLADREDADKALCEVLFGASFVGERSGALAEWNDDPARTAADVNAALIAAAELVASTGIG